MKLTNPELAEIPPLQTNKPLFKTKLFRVLFFKTAAKLAILGLKKLNWIIFIIEEKMERKHKKMLKIAKILVIK